MAFGSQEQSDFSGGVYRGRKAPDNAVYDLVNGLINDEGLPYRRGGTAYKSNADAGTALVGLADFTLPEGRVTLMWSTTAVYALSRTDDTTPTADLLTPVTGHPPRALARGVGVGDAWYAPSSVTTTNQVIVVTKAVSSNPATSNMTVPSAGASYVTGVGSPARLIVTYQNRAYFSDRGNASTIASDSYHELPLNAQIIGADSIGDTAVLFTTAGVWAISNMAQDPVDAYGNIQHQVAQVSKDLILWGDSGISGWKGAFIVPAVDDVLIFALDGSSQTITGGRGSQYDGGIRDLYRGYVEAGYSPGLAAVHRGHYFLPIVNGTTIVDTLVCRLDHGYAWSRLAGHAADIAYATRVGNTTRAPKLFGLHGGQRVLDLTGCLDPTAENVFDADGTMFDTVITTRDYPTGQQPGFFKKARVRYELVSSGFSGDDFERPDENPVAGGWLAWAGIRPKIVDGVCVPIEANYAYTAWDEAIGPDCTVTALFQAPLNVGDSIGLGLRLTAHSSAADGYTMETYNVGAGPVLNLYEGASFSQIGTAISIPAGDIDGASLSMTGPTLICLLRINGAWTSVLVVTGQSNYPDAGYPGFWVFGANGVQSFTWSGDGVDPRPVRMAFSSAADGDVFTDLTDTGEQGGGTGWRSSDGGLYQWATVGRKRERGRLRITVPAGPASFVLRSLELLTRGSGKQ